MTTVEGVITVMRMAFVWSRLALAAVLAAGAACAPPTAAREACPERAATTCDREPCDAPRLVCSESASFVLFSGRDGIDDAIVGDSQSVAEVPRIAIASDVERAYEAPAARGDVLLVAPKTSPPQT